MDTRPFEGMILTAAALVYLALGASRKEWVRIIVPAGLILSAGLLFTGFYNFRVTGSPLRMPYEVNRDTYGWPENLGFLPIKQVTFRHRVLRDMYRKEIAHHTIYSSWHAFLDSLDIRAFENWAFFCGPVLTIPLLLSAQVFLDRRTRPLGGNSGGNVGAESFSDGFVSLSPWADCAGDFRSDRARLTTHLCPFVPHPAVARAGFCCAASAVRRFSKHHEAGGGGSGNNADLLGARRGSTR